MTPWLVWSGAGNLASFYTSRCHLIVGSTQSGFILVPWTLTTQLVVSVSHPSGAWQVLTVALPPAEWLICIRASLAALSLPMEVGVLAVSVLILAPIVMVPLPLPLLPMPLPLLPPLPPLLSLSPPILPSPVRRRHCHCRRRRWSVLSQHCASQNAAAAHRAMPSWTHSGCGCVPARSALT